MQSPLQLLPVVTPVAPRRPAAWCPAALTCPRLHPSACASPSVTAGVGSLEIQTLVTRWFGEKVTRADSVHVSPARTGHMATQLQEGGEGYPEINEHSILVHMNEV